MDFDCPNCQQPLRIDDLSEGENVQCPFCLQIVPVTLTPRPLEEPRQDLNRRVLSSKSIILSVVLLVAMFATATVVFLRRNQNGTAPGAHAAKLANPIIAGDSTSSNLVTSQRVGTVVPPQPASIRDASPDVFAGEPVKGDVTLAVLGKGRIESVDFFPGSRIAQGPKPKSIVFNPVYDKPDSLWLIAEGGIEWGGVRLQGGRIYRVDAARKPILTEEGEYMVSVQLKTEQRLFAGRNADTVTATVQPGEKMQLILPGPESTSWHKVRVYQSKQIEGWIRPFGQPGSPLIEDWELTFLRKTSMSVNGRATGGIAAQGPFASSGSKLSYETMLAELRKGNLSIDFSQLRKAYTQSTNYNPHYATDVNSTIKAMNAAYAAKRHTETVKLASTVLDTCYLDTFAHYVSVDSYIALHNDRLASFHYSVFTNLIESIMGNGKDGKSLETAITVVTIREEYSMLSVFGASQRKSQSLLVSGEHEFERLTGVNDQTGESVVLYFNIDVISKWELGEQLKKKTDAPQNRPP